MTNEKTTTDQWVRREIEALEVSYTEQTSNIEEVKNALKKASKQGGAGAGKPEFVFVVNETLIIVEDKLENTEMISLDKNKEVDLTYPATANYALNGAVHYAKHIAEKTINYKDVIAIGVTGSKDNGKSLAYLVSNDQESNKTTITEIGNITDWSKLSSENFEEWYAVNVLHEESKEELDVAKLKGLASELHEDLRKAAVEGDRKATVISAILLALYDKDFKIENLTGDSGGNKDGNKIYNSIKVYLERVSIPQTKINVLMNNFSFITTHVRLNEKIEAYGMMTPLRMFCAKLKEYSHQFTKQSDYDILGDFYRQFNKYGGSDGNALAIVLTPDHITSLMAELIDIQPTDRVLDPACGSGGFLISAMNRMFELSNSNQTKENIRQKLLWGIELQEKMFTVAATNMILRGDGKANLLLNDMFKVIAFDEEHYSTLTEPTQDGQIAIPKVDKILFNPPYSQGKDDKNLTELSFINKALTFAKRGGKMAVIVPLSAMVGKSKEEKQFKREILENNTLEAVITCNDKTFYPTGTNPCIAIFKVGEKHILDEHFVKFINFSDDGYVIRKHIGLKDDGTAKEKKKHLLDVLNPSKNTGKEPTKFLVETLISPEDEWLHSFYYYNEEIPDESVFLETIQNFLTFKFEQTIKGRGYLFDDIDIESVKVEGNE